MTERTIDERIGAGLECPKCGSRHLRTVQRLDVEQDVIDGKWQTLGESFDTDTRFVECAACGTAIWQAPDYEG